MVESVVNPQDAEIRLMLPRRTGGDHDRQQLCVSLRCDVVQVRTGRRQGTTQGCRCCRSRYESTGLGDVFERFASLERGGKTDATLFRHDPGERAMWMRSGAIHKALLHKLRLHDSLRCRRGWIAWVIGGREIQEVVIAKE